MDNKRLRMLNRSNSQQNPAELINKYLKLLWRKKYFIVSITAIVSLIWVFIYPIVLKKNEFAASAVIKFDDPRFSRGIEAVTNFAQMGAEGKVAILNTNSFITNVVDSLKLYITLNPATVNRFLLYKHIAVTESAKFGNYKLVRNNNEFELYYSNKKENIEDKKIQVSSIDQNSDFYVDAYGLNIIFDTNLLQQFREINFAYIQKRYVINSLKGKILTSLDRSNTLLNITYTDANPEVAAIITNTIANLFIDKLLEHKKYRTTSVLKSLEEQLLVARRELERSEATLRTFREQNPYLLLSTAGSDLVSHLSGNQTELNHLQNTVERLTTLQKQKNETDIANRNTIYLEILSLLESQGVSGVQVFAEQFRTLLSERNRLTTDNYSVEHPYFIDNNMRLEKLHKDVDNRTAQISNQLNNRLNEIQNNVNNSQRDLRRLPRGELRLAELERDLDVNTNIYSNILVRFNEAKVSDAAIISDAFIIEEAQPPIVINDFIDTIIKLVIGPLLGLFISIAIIILLDLMDNTVKNAKDVESKLDLPVLSTLPVILDEKEFPNQINTHGQLDPKLITSDYSPSIAGEKFRLIRTKIFLDNKVKNKSLIIASLSPGDGKSLISANLAITFAQQKLPTLLVDCDLRRGVLHNSFNCGKKPGLADLLLSNNQISLTEISKIIQKTHVPNLFLISSGIQIPNPSELLGGQRMKQLHEIMEDKFGMTILDSPPIEFVPDVMVLNSFIHNILLVVRYGKTNLNKLSEKISEYKNIKDNFVGVIINSSIDVLETEHYGYSYYHY